MKFLLIFLCIASPWLASVSAVRADTPELWARIAQGGVAILLRHALAPGIGDPPDFKLDDCSTQRNLSESGRQQARLIGTTFRERQVNLQKVYTSEWCRCRETAELISVGPVNALPLLNSFFEARDRKDEQTQGLKAFLTAKPLTQTLLLVTHQVNITALTGIYPRSGQAVVVERLATDKLHLLGTLTFSP